VSWFRRLSSKSVSPTRYADDDFELVLDGEWQPDHEDTHVGFVQPHENQQVTAAAMRPKAPLDTPTLLAVALDLVAARQRAFRELSDDAMTFGDVSTEPRDGGFDVSFRAKNAERGVQSWVVVCARPQRIVTLSYNKYTPLLPDEEFDSRHQAIRSGLRIL
jgi:hypothetical protein